MYLSDGARVSLGLQPTFNKHLFALRCAGKCRFRTEAVKYSLRMCARLPAMSYLQEDALEKADKLCCTCVLQKPFEGSLK